MAKVVPFQCVRPSKELAAEVSSVPYDVVSAAEARALAKNNPNCFLRIIRSEIDFDEGQNPYADEVYLKARENFASAVENNVLSEDPDRAYYIYRIAQGEHSQSGIVALSSIDDYNSGVVKIHENTRPVKEDDRVRHMHSLGAQPGPVFLMYRSNADIERVVRQAQHADPLYDFTAEDGSTHTVWKLGETEELEQLFEQLPATYIADGHHRAKSAGRVAADLGDQPKAGYFLSVLFPDTEVRILSYNRIIKSISQQPGELLEKLAGCFDIIEGGAAEPSSARSFSLYLAGTWYELRLKPGAADSEDPVESLDISILEALVLKPVLGIEDQRTDSRIDFIGGSRGTAELERLVDSGEADAAVSMYPVTVDQLIQVADSGRLMPPKSTWFSPKLRSGLFVYRFGD